MSSVVIVIGSLCLGTLQLLKTSIIGPLLYPALLDLCYLSDPAAGLVAGNAEDVVGAAAELPDLTHRVLGLECTIARVLSRSRGGSGWYISALDPPPLSVQLQQRCCFQSMGAVGLILRLVPHMRASTMARAFADLLSALHISENATSIALHLQDWPILLFRGLMFLTPSCYPSRHDLLPNGCDVPRFPDSSAVSAAPPSDSASSSATPKAVPAATPAVGASGPSEAAQLAVDEAYASAETCLGLLARATLHVHNGWRAYHRLLSLQVRWFCCIPLRS
jgi:hypothetical protein